MGQEITELLQKLKPVLGEKRAEQLWEVYHTDPDAREEVEMTLRLLARRHLGTTFEEKSIILEPIPQEAAAGRRWPRRPRPRGRVMLVLAPFGASLGPMALSASPSMKTSRHTKSR